MVLDNVKEKEQKLFILMILNMSLGLGQYNGIQELLVIQLTNVVIWRVYFIQTVSSVFLVMPSVVLLVFVILEHLVAMDSVVKQVKLVIVLVLVLEGLFIVLTLHNVE